MSFKSVELQVAIPRSQDAGKMQEQMTKQGQKFQDTLTQQQLREELLNRQKVNQFSPVEKQVIKDEEKQGNLAEQEQKEQLTKSNQKQQEESITHPYLGKNVDFSG